MGKNKCKLDEDFLERCKAAASQPEPSQKGDLLDDDDDDDFPVFNGFSAADDSAPAPAPKLEPTVFDRYFGQEIVVREETPEAQAFARVIAGAVAESDGKDKKKKAKKKNRKDALLRPEPESMKGSTKSNRRKKLRQKKGAEFSDRQEAKAVKAELRRMQKTKRSHGY